MDAREHDRRVSELLDANSHEVERRRTAERRNAALARALEDLIACHIALAEYVGHHPEPDCVRAARRALDARPEETVP